MKFTITQKLRMFSVTMVLTLLASLLPVPPADAATPFVDVDSRRYAWAEPSINLMSSKQILIGYPDGRFRPDQAVSKAEWTMMVYRLFDRYRPNIGYDTSNRLPMFADVPQSHWGYRPIAEIYNRTFETGGYGVDQEGELAFRPDKQLTRLQLANMLYAFFDNKLISSTGLYDKEVCTLLTAYSDIPTEMYQDIQSYAAAANNDGRYEQSGLMSADAAQVFPILLLGYNWDDCSFGNDSLSSVQAKALTSLQVSGILTASEDGYFRPSEPVTRAEAVTILHRIYDFLKKKGLLDDYSSLDLGAEGSVAVQPSPVQPGTVSPGTTTPNTTTTPFQYNPSSNVITMPAPGATTPGSTGGSASVIHVRDYFDDKGTIVKDLQANGEIETAVEPKGKQYLTIDLKSKEKVDLYIIIDGKVGFVKQEELPFTLPVAEATTVGIRSQQRKTGLVIAGGIIATLSVQLSDEAPKTTKKR
jgi:hypothetical protein